MLLVTLFVVIFLPYVQLAKPTIKLTFTPDERYMPNNQQVEIQCELLNPKNAGERAQLWYVDPKNGRRVALSRASLNKATSSDLPETISQSIRRYDYVAVNHIKIRNLQMADSAKYECDCPDCEENVLKQTKELSVMKFCEPKWSIDPRDTLQENGRAVFRCTCDDFYPYVSHKILRNHHDITQEGKSTIPNATFPQKFIWEATLKAEADWHNTTLRCTVTQGNTEQHGTKLLEVSFSARFLKCDELQHVDSTKEHATIECSYSGNPAPKLNWYRALDQKPLTPESGIRVENIDEHHGKWKSIVTFDRDKLLAISLPTIPTTTNAQGESAPAYIASENYYQHLLNNGFVAKLTVGNVEKNSKTIQIVRDANDARSRSTDSGISNHISTYLMLLAFSFSMAMFIVRH